MANHFKHNAVAVFATSLTLAAAWPGQAQAREVKSLQEMQGLIRESMPDFLKNPADVVEQLLKVPLAPPLRETFKLENALKVAFPTGVFSMDPQCRRRATPAGEPDQGDCMVSNGTPTGRGAYQLLNYSKNLGNGNIKFLKRMPVDDNMTSDKLPRATKSNEDVMKMAQDFLGDALGLGMDEIPLPPTGARNSMVRSLVMVGTNDDNRTLASPIVVQKIVYLQRGFKLEKAYSEGTGGPALTHVRGPGQAMVAVDDTGIVGAKVADWQELRKDPKMTADQAKSADALMSEIAEDLYNHGVRQFEKLNFEVQIGADWRGSYGLLLPAVQVSVTPVPADPSEDEQVQFAMQPTAGLVKSYSLVEQAEATARQ